MNNIRDERRIQVLEQKVKELEDKIAALTQIPVLTSKTLHVPRKNG